MSLLNSHRQDSLQISELRKTCRAKGKYQSSLNNLQGELEKACKAVKTQCKREVHEMGQAVIACMQRPDQQLQSQPSLQSGAIHSPTTCVFSSISSYQPHSFPCPENAGRESFLSRQGIFQNPATVKGSPKTQRSPGCASFPQRETFLWLGRDSGSTEGRPHTNVTVERGRSGTHTRGKDTTAL